VYGSKAAALKRHSKACRKAVPCLLCWPISCSIPSIRRLRQWVNPFARYADDFLIVTRTQAQAQSVMDEVKNYVEGTLRLLVNTDKSKVAPLRECNFLGFNILGKKLHRTDKSAQRFKRRIQEITSRSRGTSTKQRLLELKRYCVGWFHYCLTHFVRRMSSASSSEQNRLTV